MEAAPCDVWEAIDEMLTALGEGNAMDAQTKPDSPTIYPDLFPRGVLVAVVGHPKRYGQYMGNAGQRWEGRKHRVKLADGRNRYVYGDFLIRAACWKRLDGNLRKWEIAQTWEELGQ